jgi:uroporphyrinogen decarboxylase
VRSFEKTYADKDARGEGAAQTKPHHTRTRTRKLMKGRERFYRTIERQDVDRPATWLGEPAASAIPGLLSHFGKPSIEEVKKYLGDDVFQVNVPFHSPVSDHVAAAFAFAKRGEAGNYDERTLTAPGFFEDFFEAGDVERFPWPDPTEYMNGDACREVVQSQPENAAVMVLAWSAHFQDVCSAFGMETALMRMIEDSPLFDAVLERILLFYLDANKTFYEATTGRLDAVLIGNDFGSQSGLMVDPALLRAKVLPGTKRLIDQAHEYGVKVIHHSCGSIFPIIDDLIGIGVDAIHPIQALAKDMSAENMNSHFATRVSFCGGVDAQELLVRGSPEEVETRTQRLVELFPTGLIISPSHEAILPDTPPANVLAMFRGAGAL